MCYHKHKPPSYREHKIQNGNPIYLQIIRFIEWKLHSRTYTCHYIYLFSNARVYRFDKIQLSTDKFIDKTLPKITPFNIFNHHNINIIFTSFTGKQFDRGRQTKHNPHVTKVILYRESAATIVRKIRNSAALCRFAQFFVLICTYIRRDEFPQMNRGER